MENWTQVPGCPRYQVSDRGRVTSDRLGVMREIARTPDKNGYLSVKFSTAGGQKTWRLARLVWVAFGGDIPPNIQVNHIDGVKTNNALTNLELVTAAENQRHAFRIGLRSNKGSKHSKAKLNEAAVRLIRARLQRGETPRSIANDYSVSAAAIKNIRSGHCWSHVGDTP